MTKFSSILAFATVASGALLLTAPAIAEPTTFTIASSASGLNIQTNGRNFSGTISGTAGGSQDSVGCGWMSSKPNHTFSVDADSIVSMKIRVSNPNGSTNVPYTLMIKNASDPGASSFCAIAAPGIPAEIGGVWNKEGNYQIFVGNFDSSTARDPYVLDISN